MAVVLLTRDLTVLSRVEGAVARNGAMMRAASDAAQAIEKCAAEGAGMLILDLSVPDLDVAGLVAQLEAKPNGRPRLIAFGPHVHEALLQAARAAGCDDVVSRGEFFARVDALLAPR